ncbi:MAG: two-partner secretion domain-containing protein [Thiobacillus sp.]
MNRIYRSILNHKTGTFVAAPENAKSSKSSSSGANTVASARFVLKAVAASLMLAFGSTVYASPTGGVVSAGSATITGGAGTTTITQSSQNAVINWQSFSIGAGESVQFVQPNSSAIALNRVIGPDPSAILGSLSANGKVFLLNANGILFGKGAQVNVGGLVASTLSLSDSDFMAGRYKFSGTSQSTVLNQGSINADGGYVALLGANVSNEGVISARLGTVALAAGNAVTLDVAGDGLLNVTVDQSAVNALVQNRGLIQADGGQVLLTAQAAGDLLQGVVNNTGVIQAQTIESHKGTIKLLGNMQSGTMNVSGTLDASAPNGGDGGFIETSAAHVNIANEVHVTTAAPLGLFGTWLIDPQDFIIGAGGNISGATLSALLRNNSVIITTDTGPDASVAGTPPVTTLNTATPGNGDIFVNEAVSWTAAGVPTTLTLNAARDVNINAAITATKGNLVVCCGRDVNVNAAITTVNGSVLLSAGNNVNVNAAMSTSDGNITMCAGNNINISSALTLVTGSSIPSQSLGLALGLVLNAGNNGAGPGVAGGTVVFAPLTPPAAVTGPNAPVTIYYNPTSYTTPTDYSANFTLVTSSLTQFMLVFPDGGTKVFDGTTVATLSGLKGSPTGVTLVSGPGSIANFDTADVGFNRRINFTGFSLSQDPILTGGTARNYALAVSCCGPVVGRTTGDITPVGEAIQTLPVLPLSPLPVLAALNLSVLGEGVRMPPIEVVSTPIIEPTPEVIAPPVAPPPVNVPKKRTRKADRS